jgi:hypothetical protein
MIVSELVERADFALARIWLVETRHSNAEDKERFLRLSASEGCSQVDGRIWNGIEGEFSKIRLGALKIGYIAQQAVPLHLDEHEIKHSHWTINARVEIQGRKERVQEQRCRTGAGNYQYGARPA